jgi:hypothetical protein
VRSLKEKTFFRIR